MKDAALRALMRAPLGAADANMKKRIRASFQYGKSAGLVVFRVNRRRVI
jgi:hypothetical protein